MQVNIRNLIDDVQCYQTVRDLRWPDGIACPSCQSKEVIKRGFDDKELARQRYECHDGDQRFDDLTDTIFAGHHQPLKVWILCLYFMGLNLSNDQIAQELALNGSDVQQMTAQLREGIVKKRTIRLKARIIFTWHDVIMLWWVLDMTHRQTAEPGWNDHGVSLARWDSLQTDYSGCRGLLVSCL